MNALISKVQNSNWNYVAYDPNFDVSCLNKLQDKEVPERCSWSVISHEELMKCKSEFDYIIVQNVLHEIGRFQTAALIQDCKILLKNDGSLLLLETPLLPKGEPNFVPFYDWEIPILFGHEDFTNLSTQTPRGLPVMFFRLGKTQIRCYRPTLYRLKILLNIKQKHFVDLADQLTKGSNERLKALIHLGLNDIFDYGYINVILGNIARRLLEKLGSFSEVEIDSVGADVVDMLKVGPFDSIEEILPKLISECEVYTKVGRVHGYEIVCHVLKLLSEFDAIMTLTGLGEEKIMPTWAFQEIELMGGGEEIRKVGLRECLRIAFNLSDP